MNRPAAVFASARVALAVFAAAACLSPPAHAQASRVSGQLALASQLVDRGLAITPATPVLQGSLSWTSSTGWSLGLAAGVETRSPDEPVLGLARVSYAWKLTGDWRVRTGLVYYDYGSGSPRYARDRVDAGVTFTYRDVLTLGVAAMRPLGSAGGHILGAVEMAVHWPLARHVHVSAGIGVAQTIDRSYSYAGNHAYGSGDGQGYWRERVRSYRYGQLGLGWSRGPWQLQVGRVFASRTSRQTRASRASSRWLVTASRSF